jgi:Fe-S-cluster-containing dehydrogenase component
VKTDPRKAKTFTRRDILKGAASLAAASALPLREAPAATLEEFFQKHFTEMTPDQVKKTLRRLEEKHAKQYGKKFTVSAEPALPGVSFAYGLDLSLCVGCRRCVYACVRENNLSRDPQQHWIRVIRLHKGNLTRLEDSDHLYNPELVPEEGYFYMPVQCQHCDKPACIKVCPVKATWKEPDGIVVVDYNWCIGCRFCMAACPYRGRTFNWGDPKIPAGEVNPETHYLGNRPRMKGVVDKCTFCIQRTRRPDGQGRYPACVEACPVGARKFGNLLDPKGEIRYLLENKRVFRLKEELNTEPRFYYFFLS